LLHENVVFTSVLCPRAVFLELGGYEEDQGLIGVEDYDLWLRMLEQGYAIVVNPHVLARYRLSPGLSAKVEQTAVAGRLTMERALERGALPRRERRIARRRSRLFRVVERRARAAAQPSPLQGALSLAPALPLIAFSALENPQRWGH